MKINLRMKLMTQKQIKILPKETRYYPFLIINLCLSIYKESATNPSGIVQERWRILNRLIRGTSRNMLFISN